MMKGGGIRRMKQQTGVKSTQSFESTTSYNASYSMTRVRIAARAPADELPTAWFDNLHEKQQRIWCRMEE